MATRPAVNITSPQLDGSAKNIEGMTQKHNQTMQNLAGILTPLAHATIQHGKTLEQLMNHNAQGHHAMAQAIDKLATAHLTPKKRRAIRDDKGKLTGVEEYV